MDNQQSFANSFNAKGRTVIVTGGTLGIGRSIANGFAAAGANVIICSRKAADCERVPKEITEKFGVECIGIQTDLATIEGVTAFAEQVAQHTDVVHTLVNNAGTTLVAPIDSYPLDGWENIMNLNLKAPFFLVQKLLPQLRRGATPEWPASIINIGSITGISVQPRENYAYAASKAALHHLTRVMAKNLGTEDIMVNAIAAGTFLTELSKGNEAVVEAFVKRTPARRTGSPRDIADLTCFLASPSGSFICGAVIPLDGGVSI